MNINCSSDQTGIRWCLINCVQTGKPYPVVCQDHAAPANITNNCLVPAAPTTTTEATTTTTDTTVSTQEATTSTPEIPTSTPETTINSQEATTSTPQTTTGTPQTTTSTAQTTVGTEETTPSTDDTVPAAEERTCEDVTANYKLSDKVMVRHNVIEASMNCREEGLLNPILLNVRQLVELGKCFCSDDSGLPSYKRYGFHARVIIPYGTTVGDYTNFPGGHRYTCERHHNTPFLFECPGSYTVHRCTVDCTGSATLADMEPVPNLCQRGGTVPRKEDCPVLPNCNSAAGITKNCNPGKFPDVCCKCTKVKTDPEHQADLAGVMSEIRKSLLLDAKSLHKSTAKLESAPDERASAQYSGYIAITCLVVVFGGICMSDLPRLFRNRHAVRRERKRKEMERRRKRQQQKEEEERKKHEEEERKKGEAAEAAEESASLLLPSTSAWERGAERHMHMLTIEDGKEDEGAAGEERGRGKGGRRKKGRSRRRVHVTVV